MNIQCSNIKCLKNKTKVHAAGAICWRIKNKELQILLIHRPKYDDWSLPKGKVNKHESLTQTAIREVKEEIGLNIKLGIPLPSVHYKVGKGYKHVSYWAAKVNHEPISVDNKEVDQYKWLSINNALKMITGYLDKFPIFAISEARNKNILDTHPFIVLRHAKAEPRSFCVEEQDRQLTIQGSKQSKTISNLLKAWHPTKIITSPWLRCCSTLAEYSKKQNLKFYLKHELTEKSHKLSSDLTIKIIKEYIVERESTIICSHRTVLPSIIKVLQFYIQPHIINSLPKEDPWLKPGEFIVNQISNQYKGLIVSIEKYKA